MWAASCMKDQKAYLCVTMHYRYFIQLSFDGTRYNGWQVQDNASTVQGTLDDALTTILREPIGTTGAGRTDTGVHARLFYAHFDCTQTPDSLAMSSLVYKLNRILPLDMAVHSIFSVDNEVHARFSAISRTYNYIICTKKDPFYIDRAWLMERPMNLAAMQNAADILMKHDDFSAFSKSNTQTKTNLCKVTTARWHAENHLLLFEITADRFLRNMVRAIVGTLVEIGLGKITPTDFNDIIQSKNRSQAGYSAPACGLYLVDIQYPDAVIREP